MSLILAITSLGTLLWQRQGTARCTELTLKPLHLIDQILVFQYAIDGDFVIERILAPVGKPMGALSGDTFKEIVQGR